MARTHVASLVVAGSLVLGSGVAIANGGLPPEPALGPPAVGTGAHAPEGTGVARDGDGLAGRDGVTTGGSPADDPDAAGEVDVAGGADDAASEAGDGTGEDGTDGAAGGAGGDAGGPGTDPSTDGVGGGSAGAGTGLADPGAPTADADARGSGRGPEGAEGGEGEVGDRPVGGLSGHERRGDAGLADGRRPGGSNHGSCVSAVARGAASGRGAAHGEAVSAVARSGAGRGGAGCDVGPVDPASNGEGRGPVPGRGKAKAAKG